MKNIILLLIVCLSVSCKKKDIDQTKNRFTTNEITETDTLGNLTGNVNPEDWQLKPLSQATDFDRSVFERCYTLSDKTFNNPNVIEDTVFALSKYKNNCTDTFTFKLIAYPNPLKYTYPTIIGPIPFCALNFRVQTNLKIARTLITLATKSGNKAGYEAYATLDSNLLTWVAPSQTYERDYIVYYIIYTTNGCVYFCKGNVIGC